MFSSSVQRVVFRGGGVRLCRFSCPADHRRWRQENRIRDGHNLAFAEVPVSIRHADHAGRLVDATVAVFYNFGQPFYRRLAHPLGDRGNIFLFETRHLLDALSAHEPDCRPEQPFRRLFGSVSAKIYLRQRRLLAQVSRSPALDPARVVEEALGILDDVLAAAYDEPVASGARTEGTSQRRREQAEEVKRRLYESCDRPVRLEDLAAAVGTSVYHLCRVFRQQTGAPIHRYLKRLRLRQGLVLLETAETPLAELALDTGFAHQSHFTEAFRREYGTTPGKVRRELRG